MQNSLFDEEPTWGDGTKPEEKPARKKKESEGDTYAQQQTSDAITPERKVAAQAKIMDERSRVYAGRSMRYYQVNAIKNALWQFHHNNPDRVDSTLIVCPTGSGKSLIVGGLTKKTLSFNPDYGVIVMAHREELIDQMIGHLGGFGIPATKEKAQDRGYLECGPGMPFRVAVASVQTLSRPRRQEKWDADFIRMLITDEAHHATSPSYRSIAEYFTKAFHVGVTATADRADGMNLGQVYQSLAYEYKLRQAIQDGYLMPIRVIRIDTDIDLRGVRVTAGKDLNNEDLEEIINKNVEPLADAIVKEIGNLRTMVFTPETTSAHHLALALQDVGKSAKHINYRFSKEQRERTIREHKEGRYQIITNASLLTEGYDDPDLECVVIARPTRSRSLYSQMVGRATRPGRFNLQKKEALIIDFGFNCDRMSLVSPIDLFDNSEIREDVVDRAREIVDESKEKIDIEDAIDQAQFEIENEIKNRVVIQRRKNLSYGRQELDPLNVKDMLNIPKRREVPWLANKPASIKQLETLEKFGIKVDWENPMNCAAASNLLDPLFKRANEGLARPKQVRALLTLGVSHEDAVRYTFDEAKAYIDIHKTW
jgi:superfamily II DNA or RNA helicase